MTRRRYDEARFLESLRIAQHVNAYRDWVRLQVNTGVHCYLVSFMFKALRGSSAAVISQMWHEIARVYAVFLRRWHRRPHRLSLIRLPLLIASPDLPVPKHEQNKQARPGHLLNNGLHFHAMLLVPREQHRSGMCPHAIDAHFASKQALYAGAGTRLVAVHVEPVIAAPDAVTRYAMKAVERFRLDYDGVLILPKVWSEM
jgi:hypothetical protein